MSPRKPPAAPAAAPSATLQMSDIARLAGVSESTVSRALANSPAVSARTRALVQKIAADAGYRVNLAARSLRSRRTGIISVAVPLAHQRAQHLYDPFMMTMLALLADELTERGYSMLLSKIAQHQEGWLEELLRGGRADGVIVIGQSLEHETINLAAQRQLAVVAWGEQLPDQAYPSVGSDNRLGGELATRYLIEHGRQRIAFIGDERLPEIASRFSGYRDTLTAHGLRVDRALLVRSDFGLDEAYRATKAMLAKGARPDAIFAVSDVIAAGALRALADFGLRVPQDVSVVGFDDIALAAYSHPSLTTVRQDLALGARLLVDKVLACCANEIVTSTVIPPQLIVRESA